MSDIALLRGKARAAREQGRERMADLYDAEADTHELLERMAAQQQERRIRVNGRSYRVVLNFNEKGEWYANAHARGDCLPSAYVAGHPTLNDALDAVRARLAKG